MSARTTLVQPRGERLIHLIEGEYCVTGEPDVTLTTLLGSCVAACVWDPRAAIGGMNHFLLPGGADGVRETSDANSGADPCAGHLMELLLAGLLERGARRGRMRAKLFGGAWTLAGATDVGERNAQFARRFLAREQIRMVGGQLRGREGSAHSVLAGRRTRAPTLLFGGEPSGLIAQERTEAAAASAEVL